MHYVYTKLQYAQNDNTSLSDVVCFFYNNYLENLINEKENLKINLNFKKKYSSKIVRDSFAENSTVIGKNYFYYLEPLEIEQFPYEIRSSVVKIIEAGGRESEIYKKVFNINHVYLPQYMKKEIGYDYDDVKKIKEELDLYNINKIIEFDSFEVESIDNNYGAIKANIYNEKLNKKL
jgi:hypothetical protein